MITMAFGNIGCGKTTWLCKMIADDKRKKAHQHYYANFPTTLAEQIDVMKLGTYGLPPYSLLVIDEAGIQFNNRQFKTFPKPLIEWLKLSRHYRCDIVLVSQSWDDVDITFRRLTERLYYLKKVVCFTLKRRIIKSVAVDENTHQIVDGYTLSKLLLGLFTGDTTFFLRRKYYKYFDSYDAPALPPFPIQPNNAKALHETSGASDSKIVSKGATRLAE